VQVGREALSLMVPCADMANHSNAPNAAFGMEPDLATFSLRAKQVGVFDRWSNSWGYISGVALLLVLLGCACNACCAWQLSVPCCQWQ
jgi:hypothetical protein